MAISGRTTETTVTVRRPFRLSAIDTLQPPGTYRLIVDEEEIPGVSFRAFRRTATMLHVPAIAASVRQGQVHHVDPVELAAALEADEAGA